MNVLENLNKFSTEYTEQLNSELQNIIKSAEKELAYIDMFSSSVELSLYQHLIEIGSYSSVLELGMFTGLSTLAFAQSIFKNCGISGRVLTIEPNKRYIDLAMQQFDLYESGRIIEVKHDYAKHVIPNLKATFDLIFIDADKENYPVYYDTLLPKLNPKGTMIIDNMFWSEKDREQKDRKKKIIQQLNEQIKADSRVIATFLPIRDGVQLIRWRN
jgi:caffeoyl-CoA O-methyltransferase